MIYEDILQVGSIEIYFSYKIYVKNTRRGGGQRQLGNKQVDIPSGRSQIGEGNKRNKNEFKKKKEVEGGGNYRNV